MTRAMTQKKATMAIREDESPPSRPPDDPQWERARQSWELFVDVSPLATSYRQLLRILRVKRTERADLRARLPGVVRRGARVDLLPLLESLRAAGIACDLRRRREAGTGETETAETE